MTGRNYGSFLLGIISGGLLASLVAFGYIMLFAGGPPDDPLTRLKLWQVRHVQSNIERQIQEEVPDAALLQELLHPHVRCAFVTTEPHGLFGYDQYQVLGVAEDFYVVATIPITGMNLFRTRARGFGAPKIEVHEIIDFPDPPAGTQWHPDDPTRIVEMYLRGKGRYFEIKQDPKEMDVNEVADLISEEQRDTMPDP